MAYQFHIDGEVFTGRTIPGTARIRLFYPKSGHFLAAFLPDYDSIYSGHPTGDWIDVPTYIDPKLLEKLKPQVVSACLYRRRYIDQTNQEAIPPSQK